MIKLDKYNAVFLRSNMEQGCHDPFIMMLDADFRGTLAVDRHLICIEEENAMDCLEAIELLLHVKVIREYHHAVPVIDGQFWRWGVSWLDLSQYPVATYRDPATVASPIMWSLE